MRIRIRHLLAIIFAAAIACFFVEGYIHRIAILKVKSVQIVDASRFQFNFDVADGDSPYLQSGVAGGRFGENDFFGRTIGLGDLEELVGIEVEIRYQDRDLLWLKHQGWGQYLEHHFPNTMLWPNAEEWQAYRFQTDPDQERRKRARMIIRK